MSEKATEQLYFVLSIGYFFTSDLARHLKGDEIAEILIGREPWSSGAGVNGIRDLQFYFPTAEQRAEAKNRIEVDGRFIVQRCYEDRV